ncbi:cysteine desulfurase [Ureaplasma canigenitalium]|uniref:cysteine desulfurase n=1 Tax=Ureaplasma canigenitalium TaxID=42092 RepID=UPI0004E2645C|nr:cysteine desulfurase [Ureaplasma canigenitalium]
MLDIKKQFPWFKNNENYLYLDSAATTLKPQCVIDSITEYYTKYSCNPHNNDSGFTQALNDLVYEARKVVAKLVKSETPEQIIFTSGATESLNTVANGLKEYLKKDDEVVITYAEHASNLLPWINLKKEIGIKLVYANKKSHFPTEDDIINAVNEKTKIVTFANGGNLIGHMLDDQYIANQVKYKNKDVIVVVDATQSVQHRQNNAGNPNIDFLCFSAHKLCGPTGIGALYMKEKWLPLLKPLKFGGGMNVVIQEDDYILYTDYMRYEGGTPHVAGIIGFKKCVEFILDIGYENIHLHELELVSYARKKLKENPNISVYVQNEESPTITFNYGGVFCQDFAHYLGQHKVIVRSGLSCAKLMDNIIETTCAVRASFYIYNTKDDVDRLINLINQFKRGDELDGII